MRDKIVNACIAGLCHKRTKECCESLKPLLATGNLNHPDRWMAYAVRVWNGQNKVMGAGGTFWE